MKPAVRVVNALPVVLKNAAVPAFEIAARDEGTLKPSRPLPEVPPPLISVVEGAPVILKTPSTFPTLSTTATVTGLPKLAAADTACAITVCTSPVVSVPAVALFGGKIGCKEPGVGAAPASSSGPSPVCPIPTRTRLLETPL